MEKNDKNEIVFSDSQNNSQIFDKGMPNNETMSQIESILGPISETTAEKICKYSEFEKPNEVTDIKKYDEMFEILLNNVEIDESYSKSISKALKNLLWTTLYCYKNHIEDRLENPTEAPVEKINLEWLYFQLALSRLVSDFSDEYFYGIDENYKYKSASLFKKKLEIFHDEIFKKIKDRGGLMGLLEEDDFLNVLISNECLGNIEQLYNIFPEADTSWKSSFMAAAYELEEEIELVYYTTRGFGLETKDIRHLLQECKDIFEETKALQKEKDILLKEKEGFNLN